MINYLMLSALTLFLAEEPVATNGTMEALNNVWGYIQPWVSSATFTTIATAIMVGIIKGTISKKFSKINFDERFEQMANMAFDRIKTQTLQVDIEPLVESHLAKIRQELTEETTLKIDQVKHLIMLETSLIGAFAEFFNNSAGIPQEVRDNFAKAMAEIQNYETSTEKPVCTTTVLIEEKAEKHHKKEIER